LIDQRRDAVDYGDGDGDGDRDGDGGRKTESGSRCVILPPPAFRLPTDGVGRLEGEAADED
jgi:hypothetical protein